MDLPASSLVPTFGVDTARIHRIGVSEDLPTALLVVEDAMDSVATQVRWTRIGL